MCGSDYCAVCDGHAEENGVKEWAAGETHEEPQFGDAAQMRVARGERVDAFMKALSGDPERALEFPEFAEFDHEGIRKYVGGKSHAKPQISHWPLYCRVASMRATTFLETRDNAPERAIYFPEFVEQHDVSTEIRRVAEKLRVNFDKVASRFPALQRQIADEPFATAVNDHGKRRRSARRRKRHTWQVQTLTAFMKAEGLTALCDMYQMLGRKAPWWARAAASQKRELPVSIRTALTVAETDELVTA